MNYPISQKPSDLLSWAHFVEIPKLEYPHRTIGQQSADRLSWSRTVISGICQALSLQGALASLPTVEGILYAVRNKFGRLMENLRAFPLLKTRNLFLAAITFEAYVSVHRTRQGYARKRILKPAGRFFSTQDIERIEA